MTLDQILDRLEGVKKLGNGRYMARCPAHQDKTASLGITKKEGKILMRCFAECDIYWVLGGMGLKMEDLFPDNPQSHGRPIKYRWSASQIVMALGESMSMVMFYLERQKYKKLTDEEFAILRTHANKVIVLCNEGVQHG
jgi:hypothetical protein